MCFQNPKTSETQKVFDIFFNRYWKETLTQNSLRLETNIVGNIIQPMFCF